MSLVDALTRTHASAGADAEPSAEPSAKSNASGEASALPVVWHVIVDIPLGDAASKRTGLALADAADELRQRAARIQRAQAVLDALTAFSGDDADGADSSGADGWQVSISRRGIRAERDGEAFEQLEQQLADAGFTADDVHVHVEYARSWGML